MSAYRIVELQYRSGVSEFHVQKGVLIFGFFLKLKRKGAFITHEQARWYADSHSVVKQIIHK